MKAIKYHNRRRGYAALTAMALLLIATLLGSGLAIMSINSGRMSVLRRDRESAFNIAESGFRTGLMRLKSDPAYLGERKTAFGDGYFDVTVTPVVGNPKARRVDATGTVVSMNGHPEIRSVRGIIEKSGSPPSGDYAILAKDMIDMNGGINTGSIPDGGLGNVHSNTGIQMNGGATIDGNATSVGSVLGGNVTGQRKSGAAEVPFPALDPAALQASAAVLGFTNGNVSVGTGTTRTVQGIINGNLTSSGSANVQINGIVFVTGKVSLSGGSYAGPGMLVALGDITLSGGSGFTSNMANNLAIVALSTSSTALKITGNANVRGALIVPNGTTKLSAAHITGTLATKSLVMSGSASVVKDNSFVWPDPLAQFRIMYWKED
jgi:Tfp pilus assembly protein PilX